MCLYEVRGTFWKNFAIGSGDTFSRLEYELIEWLQTIPHSAFLSFSRSRKLSELLSGLGFESGFLNYFSDVA